ncbi:PfkB family carbohydrate kinase [Paenibacillus chitinolyticus]|uniref:PfkB family carbohydrate kinase n=1 Tax=Paenibacillus chitinolyticus TaxID=79263 RepID=UPI003555F4EC
MGIGGAKFGIYASGGAVIAFQNVEIRNHISNSGSGFGAVLFSSGATVTIKEGTKVHSNKVMGKVPTNPPSVLGAGSRGVLVIEGGDITNNTIADGSNGVIIGIGNSNSPRFEMTGGKITGNKLLGNELSDTNETIGNVAVYMRGTAAEARFDFGRTAYVYDNLNGAGRQRNVYLKNSNARDSAYLTLVGAMEPGAKVGVYAKLMPNETNNPVVDIAIGLTGRYQATVVDAVYFVSDINTTAAIAFENGVQQKIVLTYRTPVELQLTEPTAGQVVGNQPTVSGTGSVGAKLSVTLVSKSDPNVSVKGEVTVKSDGTWEFTPSTSLASGDYTLQVTAVKDGVSAGPVTRDFTVVDKTALQAKVTEINGENLVEADYTPASWTELQNKLSEAYSSSEECGHLPSFLTDIVDTTGVGDAFSSCAIYGTMNNESLYSACQSGLAGAALALQTEQSICTSLRPEKIYEVIQEYSR